MAMSSGEHEDEHEEALSGVAAMASVDLEHRLRAEVATDFSQEKQPTKSAASINVYMR